MEPGVLTPMIGVKDAALAIEFYRDVFGARLDGEPHAWEGKIGHAEMDFGGSRLMLADHFPAFNATPDSVGGTPVKLHLTVLSVDKTLERAVAHGADVLRPAETKPHGRIAVILDPFGHEWFLHEVERAE